MTLLLQNARTIDQLLDAIREAASTSERTIAEAIAELTETHKLSQRDIAQRLGRSVGYVNAFVRWKRNGYVESPFTAGNRKAKAKRVQTTEQPVVTVTTEAGASAPVNAAPAGPAFMDMPTLKAAFDRSSAKWSQHDRAEFAAHVLKNSRLRVTGA